MKREASTSPKGSVTGGGTVHSIGDRIVVKGVVGQNRGTTQLNIVNYPGGCDACSIRATSSRRRSSTMDQYLADPETDESQLIKFNGVAKTADDRLAGRPKERMQT